MKEKLIDKEHGVFLGDLNIKILDYCREHSQVGTDPEFSKLPMRCAYQIAYEAVMLYNDYTHKDAVAYRGNKWFKDKLEGYIESTENLVAELKKSSTDKTSLINDVIAMNEGRVAAFKEVLKWL